MVQPREIERFASSLLDVYDNGTQLSPISESLPELDTVIAYRIAHRITALREDRGERRVGCKIGFTNRTIWPLYGVSGPMWGPVWNSTLHELSDEPITLPNLPQPRLEPEIVFGIGANVHSRMSPDRLLDCIDWISHGFEIVFSPFPDWRFTGADTAAALGLHAALYIGRRQRFVPEMATSLPDMRIELAGPGNRCLSGSGSDVLGGPIQALGFLMDILSADPDSPALSEGQVVTTGTLTDAVPIVSGDRWSTRIDGVDLPGAGITFQ